MEVCTTVQEVVTKSIPREKKCKKVKRFSQEVLQIVEKRRKVKGKGERERYTQLNGDFQRTARTHKKALLSEQRKEVKENNRMGKTRALFKKIGDIKGTFHARMGTINDRNGKEKTEAEKTKKW